MSQTKEHYHDHIEKGMRITELPIIFSTEMVKAILAGRKTMTRRIVKMYGISDAHPHRQTATWLQENKTCPYGQPGDLLWVRECFGKGIGRIYYKADKPDDLGTTTWKPSIHMPKAAARIWLEVVEIKVERL